MDITIFTLDQMSFVSDKCHAVEIKSWTSWTNIRHFIVFGRDG